MRTDPGVCGIKVFECGCESPNELVSEAPPPGKSALWAILPTNSPPGLRPGPYQDCDL